MHTMPSIYQETTLMEKQHSTSYHLRAVYGYILVAAAARESGS
jgi:hypothetical protein